MLEPTLSSALAVAHQSDLHARAKHDKLARIARPRQPKNRRTWHRPSLKIRRNVRVVTATASSA